MLPNRDPTLPTGPHRRNRIPLSCDPCRTRKLKCNRETPCQNCVTRNEHAACKFRSSNANGDALRHRIDHLENLVKRLVADRQQITSHSNDLVFKAKSPEHPSGLDVTRAGKTVMDGIHSVYHGGDDWNVVLQEVNELKRIWNQEQEDQSDDQFFPSVSHTADGTNFLFTQVKPIERLEILSSLPSKPEVDRMIARFFDRKAFPITVPPILHEPTFMREYIMHWKDPSRANFIWLGLLFSILSINMLAYPPEYEGLSESLFQLYRMRTAQCLLSGDIAKCLPYTLETLRFNATAELNRKDDNRRGLWIMSGVIVRTAINMGYHRDPSQSTGISVLQAEYRRRTWLSVTSMDDTVSFRAGFPRMITAIYSDTTEPRNLHDWELSEDTTALPPSRPLTEQTPVTYLIVKGRLFRALGRVADFNHNPSLEPYETVLEIDQAVRDAYENSPTYMKVALPEDISHPVQPEGYFSNLGLLCMYHRGICNLHRKFLAKGRVDGRFEYSRDRCISSALALLALQDGFNLSFYKFYQTREMLALAAMIVILELELRRKVPNGTTSPASDHLLQVLAKSCAGWAQATATCDEAGRVHRLLVGMLSRLHTGIYSETSSSETASSETHVELSDFFPRLDVPSGGVSFEVNLSNMNFDWDTWDTCIEGTNNEAGPAY